MKRMIGVASVTFVAALAIAAVTVVGARGRGHATNSTGSRAEFHLDAHKSRDDHGVIRVAGFGKLIAFGGTNTHPVSHGINLPVVRTLAKSGNICQFGGPATMQIRDGAIFRTVHGHATFNVTDRRNPTTAGGNPDVIRVKFVEVGNNRVFEWAGNVTQGDIEVYERVIP